MANKPPPPPKPKPKPKPKLTVYIKPSTFKQKVMQGRQSTNVIDTRQSYPGYYRVAVNAYFTYNTFFHLAANVGNNLANALLSHGFKLNSAKFSYRDTANSQYNFSITVLVRNGDTLADVKHNLTRALEATIALPNSVRIMYAYNYD
jgi:hypothetical protein